MNRVNRTSRASLAGAGLGICAPVWDNRLVRSRRREPQIIHWIAAQSAESRSSNALLARQVCPSLWRSLACVLRSFRLRPRAGTARRTMVSRGASLL
eukprot:scaffold1499_cov255-Pinguiococcus_pyrenoidosus.AAC.16